MEFRVLKSLVTTYREDMEQINQQRHIWLFSGIIVALAFASLALLADEFVHQHLFAVLWILAVCGTSVVIGWWFWIMRVIDRMTRYQREASLLFFDLLEQVEKNLEDHLKSK
jgi:hypothetical protein